MNEKILKGYDPVAFRERLEATITSFPGGVLDGAWQKVVINEAPHVEKVSANSRTYEIDRLAQMITNANIGSVAIESTHVYLDDHVEKPEIVDDLKKQTKLAYQLQQKLDSIGIGTTTILFIDDYHSQHEVSADRVENSIDMVNKLGYYPEYTILEGDMFPIAQVICDKLHEQGKTKEAIDNSGRKISLVRRNVDLFTYDSDSDKTGQASCALLDSALSLIKLRKLGDGFVNILPRKSENGLSYHGQQAHVREILKELLNVRVVPLMNIFSDISDGKYDFRQGSSHKFKKPIRK